MDFTKLQGISFDTSSNNSTLTSVPSILLDSLIPGYGLISQIIFRLLGFDIGLVVSGCLVVYGLSIAARVFYYKASGLFFSYFMCYVQIEDDDLLFDHVMKWIAEQRMTKESRSLKAVTKWVSAWYESTEERNATDDDVLDESGIFNYEKWASTIPPRYEPNFGRDRFWHQGRLFFFGRTRREKKHVSLWGSGEDECVDISCVGRSTEPIKELLNQIKKWNLNKDSKMTAIHRPTPRRESKEYNWDCQSLRPSRPMNTVSLDQEQKVCIVRDINEYLHPASARWYAARGIPYRRGYLFYGPPGTGKTSLSFALAGIFGLDIYCISLMEVGLTESDLGELFSALPRRCIVLLEDIDSAGLRRPEEPADSDSKDASNEDIKDASDNSLTKISKEDASPTAPKTTSQSSGNGIKSLISLSGLLNVIDGVASHEGRVLIMTTNCPENLDSALIRPGRVDLQVRFTLATHDQIRDIFLRMYSTLRDEKAKKPSSPSASANKDNDKKIVDTSKHPLSSTKTSPESSDADVEFLDLLSQKPTVDDVESGKLQEAAETFAKLLPAGKFSPAEIQGFLLTRKKEPGRALAEVEKWRDALLEAKAKDERVLDIQ